MAKILIVDDQQSNRDYLATLLGYGGHDLLQAADGAEALASAEAWLPDLVIADILMPTMDGFELVRRLREVPAIAATPVIFWTAHYHEREARALALKCGVASVITKPSEPEAILGVVESALGMKAPAEVSETAEEFDHEHLRLLTNKLTGQAEELRATNARLSALVQLNLQLGSELDLRRLIQELGHSARQIIGARYAITGILDESGTRFQSVFTSGVDAETAARLGALSPSAAILRAVLREDRCVRVKNPGGDPVALGLPPTHLPVYAWLGAPIAAASRVYGVVGLLDKIGLDEFTREDERLAGILAAQVGRVYQNGSLYSNVLHHAAKLEHEVARRAETEKELAGRVRQGLLIGEVGAALTRSESLEEMLQLCAEALVDHLDAAFARIWVFNKDEGMLELKASAGLYTHIDGPHGRIPIGQFKIGMIAKECKPHFTNNVLTDPRVSDKEWARQENMVAFAGHPLLVEGRLLGVMGIFAHQPLNAASTEALGSVAHEIALGIERNRANEALREREEHVRLLLDSTAEAIYGVGIEGRCTFANAACSRLLGYDHPDWLLGKSMHELIHHTRADGRPYPAEECRIVQAVQRSEGTHADDEVLWRADGTSFPAEYWSFPIRHRGEVVGTVVTFLDITERRTLENQYVRSQQRMRHVVVSSPAVLFTLEVSRENILGISWASDNLLGIFGYPPEAAVGAEWWPGNIHPDDLDRVRARVRTDLFSLGHSTEEYRFRHVDGQYLWTRSEIRLMRDEEGTPIEAVGAWSDITQWKLADEEQTKLREQLQRAQKLESIGRLAGGFAHDFNNLLTVINGYSELMLHQLTPADPMRALVAEVKTAGERAAALSGRLLVLSRKQVIVAREVKLNEIVVEVERMLQRVIGADIRLESDLCPSLGSVMADEGQVHQVLMNLAVNARDAMPRGGTLLIETANVELDDSYIDQHPEVQPGRYVQLKVSDTGTGMTKEVMSHLFEPFFTTKQAGKGTGLGLATVYSIVKQMGGSIWAYSEPDQGSSFTIYLPQVEQGDVVNEAPTWEASKADGNETILVVEDQEQLRAMVVLILRDHGYTVHEAPAPAEALLLGERETGQIDLLLTDLVMPGMSGQELSAKLSLMRPEMKVIFMSGYSERAMIDQQMLNSSGAYLAKPFSPKALAAKVREVLGPPQSSGRDLTAND